MRCNDCGSTDFKPSPSSRRDVCVDCFALRLELIKARKTGQVSAEQFAAVQRSMSTDVFRQGRPARKMKKLLAQAESEVENG
jgi:hypothetical protein